MISTPEEREQAVRFLLGGPPRRRDVDALARLERGEYPSAFAFYQELAEHSSQGKVAADLHGMLAEFGKLRDTITAVLLGAYWSPDPAWASKAQNAARDKVVVQGDPVAAAHYLGRCWLRVAEALRRVEQGATPVVRVADRVHSERVVPLLAFGPGDTAILSDQQRQELLGQSAHGLL